MSERLDELWDEVAKLPKNSVERREKFNEYRIELANEQRLELPEMIPGKATSTRSTIKPTKVKIPSVVKIKCRETEGAVEGWDECEITTSAGEIFKYFGVNAILTPDDVVNKVVTTDMMTLIETKDAPIRLLFKTGSLFDLDLGMALTTRSQFKSSLDAELADKRINKKEHAAQLAAFDKNKNNFKFLSNAKRWLSSRSLRNF